MCLRLCAPRACECVRACVPVRVRACVRVCLSVCVRASVWMSACAAVLTDLTVLPGVPLWTVAAVAPALRQAPPSVETGVGHARLLLP